MKRCFLIALLFAGGCGNNPFLAIYGSGDGPAFGAFPMDLNKIQSISSLGTLLPPFQSQPWDQTFPSDHIYLNHGGIAGLAVYAPAMGLVTGIQTDGNNLGQRVQVKVSSTLSYYFDHLSLASTVKIGYGVAVGAQIGASIAATSAVDFGVIDTTLTVPRLITPARYSTTTLHCQDPLKYYNGSLQSQLYAKVNRAGSDKDGRPDFDQAGLLVGNWFLQSLSIGNSSQDSAWSQELAFAYDSSKPTQAAVSIGGTLGIAGAYDVQSGDPDPATVSQASGQVPYHLSAGVLLVQIVGSEQIEAEFFPSPAASPAFDTNASYYTR